MNNNTPPETPGAMFIAGNRGKKSVCLDVNSEKGRDILQAMIADADVFMSNYRPVFLNRLSLDYESLRKCNPRLIYAVVNGFGPLGPDVNRPMVEGAAQARGGVERARRRLSAVRCHHAGLEAGADGRRR